MLATPEELQAFVASAQAVDARLEEDFELTDRERELLRINAEMLVAEMAERGLIDANAAAIFTAQQAPPSTDGGST